MPSIVNTAKSARRISKIDSVKPIDNAPQANIKNI